MNNITKKVFTGKYEELENKLDFSNDFIINNNQISINKDNLNLSNTENSTALLETPESIENKILEFNNFPKVSSIDAIIKKPTIKTKEQKYCPKVIKADNTDTEFIKNTDENIIVFTYESYEKNFSEYIIRFTENVDATILVVGGGGSGGYEGSGGGAGGVIFHDNYVLKKGDYVIRVGRGGDRSNGADGNNGYYSYFESLEPQQYAYGGGRGRSKVTNNAYNIDTDTDNGGSGGGGQGVGIIGQGTIGGKHNSTNSGGGGGAGQCGFDGYGTLNAPLFSGNGGNGIDLSSYFGKNVGDEGWFGGGGGGSISYNYYRYETIAGKGGKGGGGDAGQLNLVGLDAISHTGGGGGGGGNIGPKNGGSGGSGVVIIKYYSPVKLHYNVDLNEKKEVKNPKQIGVYGKIVSIPHMYINEESPFINRNYSIVGSSSNYNSLNLNEKVGIYIKYEKPTIINNIIISYSSHSSNIGSDLLRIRIDGSFDENIDFTYKDYNTMDWGKTMLSENGNWIPINKDLILDRYTEDAIGSKKEYNNGNGSYFSNATAYNYYRIIFLENDSTNSSFQLSTIKFLGPISKDNVKNLEYKECVKRKSILNSDKWYVEFNHDGSNDEITEYFVKYKNDDSGSLLLVGGGGSGAVGGGGGGGGAGAVVYGNNLTFNTDDFFRVKVGKGADRTMSAGTSNGNKGYDTTFGNIMAEGGGGGGNYNRDIIDDISNGGSGGGAGGLITIDKGENNDNDKTVDDLTSTQLLLTSFNWYGNDGNTGATNKPTTATGAATKWDVLGGGGGGAGEAGYSGEYQNNSNVWKAGDGGDGIKIDITGESIYYGGGGGAIRSTSMTLANLSNGGLGGGGRAGFNYENFPTYKSSDGEDGKGGGGGAVYNTNYGSKGGDGVVLLEYSDKDILNIYSSKRIYPPTKKLFSNYQKIDNIRYAGNSLDKYITYGNGTYKFRYSNEKDLNLNQVENLPYNVFNDLNPDTSKSWLENNYNLDGTYKHSNDTDYYLTENGNNIFKWGDSGQGVNGDWIHIELPKLIYLTQLKIKINNADFNNAPKNISIYGGMYSYRKTPYRTASSYYTEYNGLDDVEKILYYKIEDISEITYDADANYEYSFINDFGNKLGSIDTSYKYANYDNFLIVFNKLQEGGKTLKIKEIELYGFEELALKTEFSKIKNENYWKLLSVSNNNLINNLFENKSLYKTKKYDIGLHNLDFISTDEINAGIDTENDFEFTELMFANFFKLTSDDKNSILDNLPTDPITVNINTSTIVNYDTRINKDITNIDDFIEYYKSKKLIESQSNLNNKIYLSSKDVNIKLNIQNIDNENYAIIFSGENGRITEQNSDLELTNDTNQYIKIYDLPEISQELFAWWKLDSGNGSPYYDINKDDSSNTFTLTDPLIDKADANFLVSGTQVAFFGRDIGIPYTTDTSETIYVNYQSSLQLENQAFNDYLNNKPFAFSFRFYFNGYRDSYFFTILNKTNDNDILMYFKYLHNQGSSGTLSFGFNAIQDTDSQLTTDNDKLSTVYEFDYEGWNNFVCQIDDSGNREIWVNGILANYDNTTKLSFTPDNYKLVIGNERLETYKISTDTTINIGSIGLLGSLTDFRFYSNALSSYEIAKIYDIEQYNFENDDPIGSIDIIVYNDKYSDNTTLELNKWLVCNYKDLENAFDAGISEINGNNYFENIPILRSSRLNEPHTLNWLYDNAVIVSLTSPTTNIYYYDTKKILYPPYRNDADNINIDGNNISFNVKYGIFSRNVKDFDYMINKKMNTDNWRLVRYLPELPKTDILGDNKPYFHPCSDHSGNYNTPLMYGNINDYSDPWSTYFGKVTQFLYSTGNLNYWLILDKDTVSGTVYSTSYTIANLDVLDSYISNDITKKYKSKSSSNIYWSNAREPLITIKGSSSTSINKYLYGGDAFDSTTDGAVNQYDITNDEGLLLFVRNTKDYYVRPYEYTIKGGNGIRLDIDEKYLKVWYNFRNNYTDSNPSSTKYDIEFNGTVSLSRDSIYGLSAKFPGGTSNNINHKGYLKITDKFNTYDLWKDEGITISLFYKFNASSNWCALFEFSIDDSINDRISLMQNATNNKLQARITINNTSFTRDIANEKVLDNKWHHIAWIIDNLGEWTIYVDGIRENFSLNCPLHNKHFNTSYFGKRTDSSGLFDGYLDDIRIYSKRLYSSEIFSIYNLLNQNLTYIDNINNLNYYDYYYFSQSWYDSSDGYTCVVYENLDKTTDFMEYMLNFENRVDAYVLIVGGGGAGGKGGGGGAGELIFFRELLDPGNYKIKVGRGGNVSDGTTATGTGIGEMGYYSEFNNIKAYGGMGGIREIRVGGVYGCGGGAGYDDEEYDSYYYDTIKYTKNDNTKSIGGRTIQNSFGSGGGGGGLGENGFRSLTDAGLWVSNNSSKLYDYFVNKEITISCCVKVRSSGVKKLGQLFYGSLKGSPTEGLLPQWYGGFGINIENDRFRFRVSKYNSDTDFTYWDSDEIEYYKWYVITWSLRYNGISKFDINEHYTKITIGKENGDMQYYEANDFYYPYFNKTYDFSIGCWTCETWYQDNTNKERNFNGYINDFRIYDKVLNTSNANTLSTLVSFQDTNTYLSDSSFNSLFDNIEKKYYGDDHILLIFKNNLNQYNTNFSIGINNSSTVDILIVGGGGAGGLQYGGGGGAGGLIFLEGYQISNGTYNISVGGGSKDKSRNGNRKPVPNYPKGKRGFDSRAFGYTIIGGGNGGGDDYPGSHGGSGGGGSDLNSDLNGGAGGYGIQSYYDSLRGIQLDSSESSNIYGYGEDGGAGADSTLGGGGGGGAGGTGFANNAASPNQRVGGEGKDMSSYFGTEVGDNGWFCGGGGGSTKNQQAFTGYPNGGADYFGGGGRGGFSGNHYGESGMNGTGGGGGGLWNSELDNDMKNFGNGGSGVVIIKILKDDHYKFSIITEKKPIKKDENNDNNYLLNNLEDENLIIWYKFDDITNIGLNSSIYGSLFDAHNGHNRILDYDYKLFGKGSIRFWGEYPNKDLKLFDDNDKSHSINYGGKGGDGIKNIVYKNNLYDFEKLFTKNVGHYIENDGVYFGGGGAGGNNTANNFDFIDIKRPEGGKGGGGDGALSNKDLSGTVQTPGFIIYKFLLSDNGSEFSNLRITEDTICDILIVGGGGGGGKPNGASYKSGGGGGGGVVYITNKLLTKDTTYKIIVGDGGAGRKKGIDTKITYDNDEVVVLDTISLIGYGGGCGLPDNVAEVNGGSGGGGGHQISGGKAIQGNTIWNESSQSYIAGGTNGWNYPDGSSGYNAGPGGGAGGLGVGIVLDISGESIEYGKGGAYASRANAPHHTGQGGDGYYDSPTFDSDNGGSGGSGIVIIRMHIEEKIVAKNSGYDGLKSTGSGGGGGDPEGIDGSGGSGVVIVKYKEQVARPRYHDSNIKEPNIINDSVNIDYQYVVFDNNTDFNFKYDDKYLVYHWKFNNDLYNSIKENDELYVNYEKLLGLQWQVLPSETLEDKLKFYIAGNTDKTFDQISSLNTTSTSFDFAQLGQYIINRDNQETGYIDYHPSFTNYNIYYVDVVYTKVTIKSTINSAYIGRKNAFLSKIGTFAVNDWFYIYDTLYLWDETDTTGNTWWKIQDDDAIYKYLMHLAIQNLIEIDENQNWINTLKDSYQIHNKVGEEWVHYYYGYSQDGVLYEDIIYSAGDLFYHLHNDIFDQESIITQEVSIQNAIYRFNTSFVTKNITYNDYLNYNLNSLSLNHFDYFIYENQYYISKIDNDSSLTINYTNTDKIENDYSLIISSDFTYKIDYLQLPDTFNIYNIYYEENDNDDAGISICIRYKITQNIGVIKILDIGESDSNNILIELNLDNNTYKFKINSTEYIYSNSLNQSDDRLIKYDVFTNEFFNLDQWYLLVWTINKTNGKWHIYLNDKLILQKGIYELIPNHKWINRILFENFIGKIDSFRIYKRVLNLNEVKSLYNLNTNILIDRLINDVNIINVDWYKDEYDPMKNIPNTLEDKITQYNTDINLEDKYTKSDLLTIYTPYTISISFGGTDNKSQLILYYNTKFGLQDINGNVQEVYFEINEDIKLEKILINKFNFLDEYIVTENYNKFKDFVQIDYYNYIEDYVEGIDDKYLIVRYKGNNQDFLKDSSSIAPFYNLEVYPSDRTTNLSNADRKNSHYFDQNLSYKIADSESGLNSLLRLKPGFTLSLRFNEYITQKQTLISFGDFKIELDIDSENSTNILSAKNTNTEIIINDSVLEFNTNLWKHLVFVWTLQNEWHIHINNNKYISRQNKLYPSEVIRKYYFNNVDYTDTSNISADGSIIIDPSTKNFGYKYIDDYSNISKFNSNTTYVFKYDSNNGFDYTKYKFKFETDQYSNNVVLFDILIVAGGGGGGMDMGGGGGAGGIVYIKDIELQNNQVYNIIVGRGGDGAPAGNTYDQGNSHSTFNKNAYNGINSSFENIVAFGGGYGGSSNWNDVATATVNLRGKANSGGSGGGASGYNSNSSEKGGKGIQHNNNYSSYKYSKIIEYGNSGGSSTNAHYSGGGGGAGQVGGRGNTNGVNMADGGNGVEFDILGTSYYWGGGGGGAGYSNTGGDGGEGGGGGGAVNTTSGGASWTDSDDTPYIGNSGGGGAVNSQTNKPGGNAASHSGGGGGGGSHYNLNNKGGNGGSGVVIIKCLEIEKIKTSSSDISKKEILVSNKPFDENDENDDYVIGQSFGYDYLIEYSSDNSNSAEFPIQIFKQDAISNVAFDNKYIYYNGFWLDENYDEESGVYIGSDTNFAGTGAVATVTVPETGIIDDSTIINITTQGNGYAPGPLTLTITGTTGTEAVVTVTVSETGIIDNGTTINITTQGDGYTPGSSLTLNITEITGDWIHIKMPKQILLKKYIFTSVNLDTNNRKKMPIHYAIYGCNNKNFSEKFKIIEEEITIDDINKTYNDIENVAYEKYIINNQLNAYDTFLLIVYKIGSASQLAMGNWLIYGYDDEIVESQKINIKGKYPSTWYYNTQDESVKIIGGEFSGSDVINKFNGFIDDIKIYNKALEDHEVDSLFQQNDTFTINNVKFYSNYIYDIFLLSAISYSYLLDQTLTNDNYQIILSNDTITNTVIKDSQGNEQKSSHQSTNDLKYNPVLNTITGKKVYYDEPICIIKKKNNNLSNSNSNYYNKFIPNSLYLYGKNSNDEYDEIKNITSLKSIIDDSMNIDRIININNDNDYKNFKIKFYNYSDNFPIFRINSVDFYSKTQDISDKTIDLTVKNENINQIIQDIKYVKKEDIKIYPVERNFESKSKIVEDNIYGNGEYIIWASSEVSDYEAYNLFNYDITKIYKSSSNYDNYGNYKGDNTIDGNYYGEWIKVKLTEQIYLKKYKLEKTNINSFPGEFKIYASNDNINWDVIIDRSYLTKTDEIKNNNSGLYQDDVLHKRRINRFNDTISDNIFYIEEVDINHSYQYYAIVVNRLIQTGTIRSYLELVGFYLYGTESYNSEELISDYDGYQINKLKTLNNNDINIQHVKHISKNINLWFQDDNLSGKNIYGDHTDYYNNWSLSWDYSNIENIIIVSHENADSEYEIININKNCINFIMENTNNEIILNATYSYAESYGILHKNNYKLKYDESDNTTPILYKSDLNNIIMYKEGEELLDNNRDIDIYVSTYNNIINNVIPKEVSDINNKEYSYIEFKYDYYSTDYTEYTFTVPTTTNVDILIIGGGGGGSRKGGGGGAGTVIYDKDVSLLEGDYRIKIGRGGKSSIINNNADPDIYNNIAKNRNFIIGENGFNSQIILDSNIIYNADGGGGGTNILTQTDYNLYNIAPSGGSGGGGGGSFRGGLLSNDNIVNGEKVNVINNFDNEKSSKPIYDNHKCFGNRGGIGRYNNGGYTYGGGGGGAGAIGGDVHNSSSTDIHNDKGYGGNGIECNITGINKYYGGGGGGANISHNQAYYNKGGLGGGGDSGTSSLYSKSGIDGTGGGGGGGYKTSDNGGTGGAGIIIIRYKNTLTSDKFIKEDIDIDINLKFLKLNLLSSENEKNYILNVPQNLEFVDILLVNDSKYLKLKEINLEKGDYTIKLSKANNSEIYFNNKILYTTNDGTHYSDDSNGYISDSISNTIQDYYPGTFAIRYKTNKYFELNYKKTSINYTHFIPNTDKDNLKVWYRFDLNFADNLDTKNNIILNINEKNNFYKYFTKDKKVNYYSLQLYDNYIKLPLIINNYIGLHNNINLEELSELTSYTISFWCKFTSDTDYLISANNSTNYFSIYYNTNKLYWERRYNLVSGTNYIGAKLSCPFTYTNEWVHITLVSFMEDNLLYARIFINNIEQVITKEQEGTNNFDINNYKILSNINILLGGYYSGDAITNSTGTIQFSDFRIYNKTLTREDVNRIYNIYNQTLYDINFNQDTTLSKLLVAAGGGAGGGDGGGGGGAGGITESYNSLIKSGPYNLSVGKGGTNYNTDKYGESGFNSEVLNIVTYGGGGGGGKIYKV